MMPKDLLDIEKIRTGLVEMCSERVAEGMGRHSVRQSEDGFLISDAFVDPSGIEGL